MNAQDLDVSPPKEPHPIALEAYRLAHADGGRRLTEESFRALESALHGIADLNELFKAIVSLEATAMTFEHLGATEAASQLRVLYKGVTSRFDGIRADLASQVQDTAESKAARFSAMTGVAMSTVKAAPQVAQKKPAGTVSLSSILPRSMQGANSLAAKRLDARRRS